MRSNLNFVTFWGVTLVFLTIMGALAFCGFWFGKNRKVLTWVSLVVFGALIFADLVAGREAFASSVAGASSTGSTSAPPDPCSQPRR